jgi:hypothetical protein
VRSEEFDDLIVYNINCKCTSYKYSIETKSMLIQYSNERENIGFSVFIRICAATPLGRFQDGICLYTSISHGATTREQTWQTNELTSSY